MKDVYLMERAGLSIEIEKETGIIRLLKEKQGKHDTNYVGNEENISDSSFIKEPYWLGDVLLRTWAGDGWQKEVTTHSGDIRQVEYNQEKGNLEVSYSGKSANRDGLKSVALKENYYFKDDAFHWDIKITNIRDELLEIGELALPFTMNIDYASLFRGEHQLEGEDWRGIKQKKWHENKVMLHLFISGHSSYATLQRPLGDFPFLFFQPLGDTALEAAYQAENTEGSQWELVWEGQYQLAIYSWATKFDRKWKWNKERQKYWINGNTSLLLRPGQSKIFRFRFTLLGSYKEVNEQLYESDQIAVNVHPGMVVPCEQNINLELKSKQKPTLVPEANNIEICSYNNDGDSYRYKIHFSKPGQKKIRVNYGNNKWTNLFFYALPPLSDLLKARAEFIIERHFYENPFDPYNRHHAFLPYDDDIETLFLESSEQWQVGGSNEYCLPIAMYLAEKNVYYPNERQIEILEKYINDFLFNILQNPVTYEIKAGLYWRELYPSSPEGQWDKKRSEQTWRALDYPLVTNIYHSMYRIAKLYGLTKEKSAKDYLNMAWRTALKWFDTGKHKEMGAPAGSNVINILQDLKQEDHDKYVELNKKMIKVADKIVDDPYPYGSELYVDQTAHDQVHAFMKHYGHQEKMEKTLQITKALRAGGQPLWFRYGNEKRGNVCIWYAQTLNSRTLLSGFEDTGDYEMLKWGYGGLTSFLTTIRTTGVAHGWFTWWPDRTEFDLRSLDTDLGLYGYLKAAKSYVVNDEIFGLVGYGCHVDKNDDGIWSIKPWDGLQKRIFIEPLKIDITIEKGELTGLEINPDDLSLTLMLDDSTGLVKGFKMFVKGITEEKCLTLNNSRRIIHPENGMLTIENDSVSWPVEVIINSID